MWTGPAPLKEETSPKATLPQDAVDEERGRGA
jgi:hypothetical protein